MKKLSVVVRDRNTLVLEEAGSPGDYIDLSTLSNVDFSNIEAKIEAGRDSVYQKKLEEYASRLQLEKEKEVSNLQHRLEELAAKHKADLALQEQEQQAKHQEEIYKLKQIISEYELKKEADLEKLRSTHSLEMAQASQEQQQKYQELSALKNTEIERLKMDLETLKASQKQQLEVEKLQLREQYTAEVNELKKQLEKNQQQTELSLKDKDILLERKLQEIKAEYEQKLLEKDTALKEKEDAYLSLQRQRAMMNVKQTGEDLEAWCNHEMLSYMQNGLETCTWEKDNVVVREEYEAKGSKADYLFKVYASSAHVPEELITSVCLDMKDENPDSVNRKKNSDYYRDLDKNRNKKNCRYAVLVSNLEADKANDLPIFKVNEYTDMYVVRPAYMMTFLNMLVSLSRRFAELILSDKDAKLELVNALELKNQFESLKNTYLDKPLEQLEKNIEAIRKNNDSILKASRNIEEVCDTIARSYLNSIQEKLNKFEIKINREYKKYEGKEAKMLVVSK